MKNYFPDDDDDCICSGCGETYTNCVCDQDDILDDEFYEEEFEQLFDDDDEDDW